MALDATTVLEYGTGGNQNNGGGYASGVSGAGTDYSQSDSYYREWLDLACTANSTTVTSAGGNFDSSIVGSILNIYTAPGTGNTAGLYCVMTYVDPNTITIDRVIGTSNNMTNGYGRVGGRLLVPLDAHFEQMVGGNKAWIRGGTYTYTAAISVASTSSTATAPIVFEGYNTTRGDAPTGTNRPILNMSSNGLTFGQYWRTSHVRYDGSRSGQTLVSGGTGGIAYNCSFNNSGASATSSASQSFTYYILCELTAASGVALAGGTNNLLYCYLHDSLTGASFASTNTGRFFYCVFDTLTNGLIQSAATGTGAQLHGCIFYKCTSYGIKSDGAFLRTIPIMACIFHTCGTAISDTVANGGMLIMYNIFYNNTTDISTTYLGTLDSTNITGVNPQLTDPDNKDFTVKAGSNALKAFPQLTMAGLVGDYKINIGIDQDDLATQCYAFAA
jgi:hypothetical protein